MENIIEQMKMQADKLGQCGSITGKETMQEIVDKLLSKQGREFCIANRFPSMTTFAAFKAFDIHEHGVFINFGGMVISDRKRIVLVGRTSATINCHETAKYEIMLMHGAKAVINANNWAVVMVHATDDCEVMRNAAGHAIII